MKAQRHEGVTVDLGVGATVTAPLPFGLKTVITATAKQSSSLSRQLLQITDIQGDGCADIVTASGMFPRPNGDADDNLGGSSSTKEIELYANPDCKNGLLRQFDLPNGAKVAFDFALSVPNSKRAPQSRWNLHSITRSDGFEPNPGEGAADMPADGVDLVRQTFAYEKGNYSRLFRQFLGYGSVTQVTSGKDCAAGVSVVRVFGTTGRII